MNFLLDTNVNIRANDSTVIAGVLARLAEVEVDRVFLTVVTITELRYGIERLATSRVVTVSIGGCRRT